MNKIMLKGRLTREPQLRTVGADKIAVCDFSIAVNRRFDKEVVDFINCQAWRKTGEFVKNYFTKGKEILVIGELHIEKYINDDETRYQTRVVVDEVEFCGSKSDSSAEAPSAGKAENNFEDANNDEELPF